MNGLFFDMVAFLVHHYQIFLLLPIIMALKVEKYYVERASILSNTVGMFPAITPYWAITHSWLNIGGFPIFHAYVLLRLIFGIMSFVSYVFGLSEDTDFYLVT